MSQLHEYSQKIVTVTANELLAILDEWRGSHVPRSREELCQALRCSEHVLQQAIEHLRHGGHLIMQDRRGGYRFAYSAEEVYAYTHVLRERGQRLLETAEAMETRAQSTYAAQLEYSSDKVNYKC